MTRSNHKLIDTHAHICDSTFDPDRAEVLEKARAVGVAAVIAVGENLSDRLEKIFPTLAKI
jgi:Tat protein secretion system quality control protein TatD with DNase activity